MTHRAPNNAFVFFREFPQNLPIDLYQVWFHPKKWIILPFNDPRNQPNQPHNWVFDFIPNKSPKQPFKGPFFHCSVEVISPSLQAPPWQAMFRASSKQRRSPNFSFSEPLGVPDLPGKFLASKRIWGMVLNTDFSVFEFGIYMNIIKYISYVYIYIYLSYPKFIFDSWIINLSFFLHAVRKDSGQHPLPAWFTTHHITFKRRRGWNTPALGDWKITKQSPTQVTEPCFLENTPLLPCLLTRKMALPVPGIPGWGKECHEKQGKL